MSILAKVGAALQQLVGEFAQTVAQDSGVIQRQRKFTARSLARTFILGFLQNPRASDEELAQMALQCGAEVTPQAIEQRHTPRLADFLQRLFHAATRLVIGSETALAPLLERFTAVTVLDSTTLTLPDGQREEFRGCGGGHGGGVAALKLQTELDLRSGAITQVAVEPGRCPDAASARQHAPRPAGSLRITDLGYFDVSVFTALVATGGHFLSRLQIKTQVRYRGVVVDVLKWLRRQPGLWVDEEIELGRADQLPCRLIAWRLPPEQVRRRRRKLWQQMKSRKGRRPSAERLAWCSWTILVTSVPGASLTVKEAAVLYRARWQVELLFKRWKSQGLVAELSGSTEVRQMVRVWSRLLAALVQHWLLTAGVRGDGSQSLDKAAKAVRGYVGRLAASLTSLVDLVAVLADLTRTIAKTCQRNKRSKPGTFELLNNAEQLDFRLT